MATTTTNLGMTLPTGTENVNRATLNGNFEIIDDAVGALPSGKTFQGQINDITGEIGNTSLPTTAQTLTGAIAEHETDLGTKADKVSSATDGNFAALDSNGNLTDSGHDHDEYIGYLADKADKVSSATNGHFAGLDSNGNLTDSGKSSSDFIASSEKGAASGVATLDSGGKIPTSQLPSMANDVIEGYYYNGVFYSDSAHTIAITGETGKIYTDLSTDKAYRFADNAYVLLSAPDDTKGIWDTEYSWSADKSKKELDKKSPDFAPVIHNDFPEEIKTIENCAENMGMGVEIPINPVQDLHGYEYPWVGGAGKNLLSLNNISQVKPATRNVSYDIEGIPAGTYTFTYDISGTAGTVGGAFRDANGNDIKTFSFTSDSHVVTVTNSVEIKRLYVYIATTEADGATANITNMMLRLSSVTDDSFAPYSNICPISGFDGVDIIKAKQYISENEIIHGSYIDNSGNVYSSGNWMYVPEYIEVEPDTTYCLTYDKKINWGNYYIATVCLYNSSKTFITRLTPQSADQTTGIKEFSFTTTSATKYIRISLSNDGEKVVLSKGSTNKIPISWQSTAGTVYGGTVTINEDGSGKLIVDQWGKVFEDGTGFSGVTGWEGDYAVFRYDSTSRPTAYATNASAGVQYCKSSHYKADVINSSGTTIGFVAYNNFLQFRPVGVANMSTTDWGNWIAQQYQNGTPLTATYKIREPIEYTLTPQQITSLFGTNTLWNSIGTFSMSYHLDPKVYVDDVAGIKGSIAVTDSTEASVKTLTDGAENLPMEVEVAINPVQDTHGFDPYPAGGGKNLLPITVAILKSCNTSGTWNGNKYTVMEVTFTVNTDSDGNVTGITANGTATGGNAGFNFANGSNRFTLPGNIIVNGCPANGSTSTYRIVTYGYKADGTTTGTFNDVGSGVTIDASTYPTCYSQITIYQNNTVNLEFKPMYRLASVSDATFAPYSNICPISGWDAVGITRTGKNLFNKNTVEEKGIIHKDTGLFVSSTSTTWCASDYIPVIAGQKITRSRAFGTGTNPGYGFYDADKNVVSHGALNYSGAETLTVPNGAMYYRTSVATAELSTTQVENGESASNYEPFGQTYPISLPTTAYGGTLTVNKDGSGRLVVDKGVHICDGTETVVESTTNGYMMIGSGENSFMLVFGISDTQRPIPMVSHYKGVTHDAGANLNIGDACTFLGTHGRTIGIKTTFDETSDFTTYLTQQYNAGTPVTFVLPLASPVVFDFTAQQIRSLLGNVNVFSDSGNVLNVVYMADQKMYIDNLFNSILPATGVSF